MPLTDDAFEEQFKGIIADLESNKPSLEVDLSEIPLTKGENSRSVDDSRMHRLIAALEKNTSLVAIIFRKNDINAFSITKSIDDNEKEVCCHPSIKLMTALLTKKKNPPLKKLVFSDNALLKQAMVIISEHIKSGRCVLEHIDVSNSFIADKSLTLLTNALYSLRREKNDGITLNLSGCTCTFNIMQKFFNLFLSTSQNGGIVNKLILTDVDLTKTGYLLIGAVRSNSFIKSLDLSRCRINDQQVLSLLDHYGTQSNFEVTLNGVNLTEKYGQIKQVMEALKRNELDILDLSRLIVNDQEASVILSSLQKSSSVTAIFLDPSQIKNDDTLRSFCEVFVEQDKIETFTFINSVPNYKYKMIVDGLSELKIGIKTLKLDHCRFIDKDLEFIIKMVNKYQIHEVDLSGNHLTDVGADELLRAINNNKCLLSLNLQDNDTISNSYQEDINVAIKNNVDTHDRESMEAYKSHSSRVEFIHKAETNRGKIRRSASCDFLNFFLLPRRKSTSASPSMFEISSYSPAPPPRNGVKK